MGSAANNSSGEMKRFGLSATAAAAALYGAVILFGVGPATPSAAGPDDLRAPVVLLPHGSATSGPAQGLPQVSPGPDPQRSRHASPEAAGSVTAVAAPAGGDADDAEPVSAPGELPPESPTTPKSSAGSSDPAPPVQSSQTAPAVTVPAVTTPVVTTPTVTVPLPVTPVPLPAVPELTALPPPPPAPKLPLP